VSLPPAGNEVGQVVLSGVIRGFEGLHGRGASRHPGHGHDSAGNTEEGSDEESAEVDADECVDREGERHDPVEHAVRRHHDDENTESHQCDRQDHCLHPLDAHLYPDVAEIQLP